MKLITYGSVHPEFESTLFGVLGKAATGWTIQSLMRYGVLSSEVCSNVLYQLRKGG
ncbi:MAG: hypothetical protein HYU27_00800 [Acidobacteria bacterium]|nr:hypothetical protein [Acidobacteriota bacterium]